MEVLILNRQSYPVNEEELRELSCFVLEKEGTPQASELSVALVEKGEISELNEKYLGRSRPTDVLSFAMEEMEEETWLLGDVVICPEEVFLRKEEYGVGEGRELAFVLIHGILHLMGYDDIEEEENARMDSRQRALLREWEGRMR